MSAPYGIHWFRRDLRVTGNSALDWIRSRHGSRVLGLFCIDPGILSRKDFCESRFSFLLSNLKDLREVLRHQGGDLLVAEGPPVEVFPRLMAALQSRGQATPAAVSFGRDYEPFARARDEKVRALLKRSGIQAEEVPDHLLIQPEELVKDAPRGAPNHYQVFTPFKKRWLAIARQTRISDRIRQQSSRPRTPRLDLSWGQMLGRSPALPDVLDDWLARTRPSLALPPAGEKAARAALRAFARERLAAYEKARDFPAAEGTSRLSPYLKFGSLTVAQVIGELGLLDSARLNSSSAKYLEELIWREFYVHVLFHRPEVEGHAFRPALEAIRWENDEELFAAWQDGRTGYPIVDAGMRQLRETGFMHNRLRMITASFLVKDLHVDWKWGERYFMRNLLDGDLASNNGGWQWAASTGCDPQPYFRIFNPELQGKRFDAEGEFVRRWVPELKDVPPRKIHAPGATRGYPVPVVEHSQRARRIVSLYREVSRSESRRAD